MRYTKRTLLVWILAAAATLGALTGNAQADIPGADGNVTACYNTASGVLRVIDAEAGQECAVDEEGLVWAAAKKPRPTTSTTTSTTLPETTTSTSTTTTLAPTTTTTTVLPTTTTQPPGPSMIFGQYRDLDGYSGDPNGSTSRSDFVELQEAKAQWPAIDGHARQFYPPGSLPLNSAADQLHAAGWPLFVNWKPHPTGSVATAMATTCNGGYNSQITTAANEIKAKAPAIVRITLYHEPDGDGHNAAARASYRCMWKVVQNIFRDVGATNVQWVWTITGFDIPNRIASGELPGLWPGVLPGTDPADPDGTRVDFGGYDPYISGTESPATLPQKMIDHGNQLRDFLATQPGGPSRLVQPEWGTDLNTVRGTVEHRAAAYDAVRARIAEIRAVGVEAMYLFDAREHHIRLPQSYPAGSPLIDGTTDEIAYGQLVSAA